MATVTGSFTLSISLTADLVPVWNHWRSGLPGGFADGGYSIPRTGKIEDLTRIEGTNPPYHTEGWLNGGFK